MLPYFAFRFIPTLIFTNTPPPHTDSSLSYVHLHIIDFLRTKYNSRMLYKVKNLKKFWTINCCLKLRISQSKKVNVTILTRHMQLQKADNSELWNNGIIIAISGNLQ